MSRRGGTLSALIVAAVALLAPARAARAHSFDPAVLDLRERSAGRFDVVWKIPVPITGATDREPPTPHFPRHCRDLGALADLTREGEGPQFWQIDCGAMGMRGAALSASGLDRIRLDAIIRITWADGDVVTGVLHGDHDEFVVPNRRDGGFGADAPARAVAIRYVQLGIDHILFGFDHLLFVLGLLLLVDGWGRLLKTITAFTAAHSLALALAVLGIVHAPPAPIEAMIAASIVLVALELTRATDAPPGVSRRYPWAVAFLFGLLHGLGFAGALAAIGLPPGQLPLALFAFNVGVEIGQLAFVGAALAPLAWLRRIARSRRWVYALPAYAIGAVAMAWLFERVQRFWTL